MRHPPPPPPPAQVEVVPATPGPAYVWVRGTGDGAARGADMPGSPERYAVPAQPSYEWVPGYWAPRPGGWVWVEGHWRAR